MTSKNIETNIDVIIPVYNGQDFIIQALDSVINQTLSPNKIIVVNDGSTDTTAELITGYATNSKVPIELVNKKNGGLSSARNAGVNASNTQFIAFLDADDTWDKYKLEKQLEVFENTTFKNLGLVYCDYDIIDSDNKIIFKNYKAPLDYKNMRGNVFKKLLERNQIASSGSGVLIKREVFEKTGLFDENLKFGEDWDMWLRIAKVYEVDFADKILVHIRKHGSNMTANPTSIFEREIAFYKKWIASLDTMYIPLFWADKITYRILVAMGRANLLKILQQAISKEEFQKLFKISLGSFYLYIPIFVIRQILNLFIHPRIILGLLKNKGR